MIEVRTDLGFAAVLHIHVTVAVAITAGFNLATPLAALRVRIAGHTTLTAFAAIIQRRPDIRFAAVALLGAITICVSKFAVAAARPGHTRRFRHVILGARLVTAAAMIRIRLDVCFAAGLLVAVVPSFEAIA